MHPVFYLALLAGGSCVAHYRGFDNNLVERDEPQEIESNLVECPVCEDSSWLPNNEACNISVENKLYKRCAYGVYINDVCGKRRDCYRGPGEQCTEKMDVDIYGQRCGHGLYCNKAIGKCTGLGYTVNSNVQYVLNPVRYPLPLRVRRQA
ncbi:uncharacterized protein [Choristoneura fumiferana]|uniref:uncharacterized protein n=1 Tax=Choristoneura fumiferana TaxID=7141 RepID=UPI003D159160